MNNDVILPKLGLTMTVGKITNWYKKVGDKVSVGDDLFDFETDKAQNTVQSEFEGFLTSILVNEGDETPVFSVTCTVGDEMGEVSKDPDKETEINSSEKKIEKTVEVKKEVQKCSDGKRIFISPLAKKVAMENKVDIAKVKFSGARITKKDVLKYLATKPTVSEKLAAAEPVGMPLVGVRKAIAEKMSQSKREIPHVYFKTEVNFSKIIDLKKSYLEKNDVKLTYTTIILKIIAKVIEKYPMFNAQFVDGLLYSKNSIDISVAIDREEGLVAPCIFDMKDKSLATISADLKALVASAKENKLTSAQMSEGGFSFSNLGTKDVTEFQAVVNYPQVAILSSGKMEKRVIVENDEMKIAPMVNFVLSCDHRIIDGSLAASFLTTLKMYAENPDLML